MLFNNQLNATTTQVLFAPHLIYRILCPYHCVYRLPNVCNTHDKMLYSTGKVILRGDKLCEGRLLLHIFVTMQCSDDTIPSLNLSLSHPRPHRQYVYISPGFNDINATTTKDVLAGIGVGGKTSRDEDSESDNDDL